MFFAKLHNGIPVEYPISEKSLRDELSKNMSLPSIITPDTLIGTNFICVKSEDVKVTLVPTLYHKIGIVSIDPREDGYWIPKYELIEVEESMLNRRLNEKLEHIREQRKAMFQLLDSMVLKTMREIRMGQSPTYSISELDRYGQELADITSQENIFAISWPVPPSTLN